jgi:DNA repair protein RadC
MNNDMPRPPRRRRRDNHEFGVIRLRELPVDMPSCDCPDRIYEYWQGNIATAAWYNPDVECLCVVHLNTRRRATGFHLAGIGTLDTVLMHAREIFRTAILRTASAVVIAHSHPSGDPMPSEADIKATRELIRAGQLLRIEVLDHVIIGRPEPQRPRPYASMRELGYFM